jgi:hypothetical protein
MQKLLTLLAISAAILKLKAERARVVCCDGSATARDQRTVPSGRQSASEELIVYSRRVPKISQA